MGPGAPAPGLSGSAAPPAGWLRIAAAAPEAAVRLLCIGHAGSGASGFNGWSRYLPPAVQLVKVQLPGREDQAAATPLRRVAPLIEQLFPQVVQLLDRPLAIYGHSMGALVAFELARELRRRGKGLPVALLVSGRRAPHKPLRHPFLHAMSDADLVAHLRHMGGTAGNLLDQPRWRDRFLPAMRADLELSDLYQYQPQPPLACPLYAFLGEEDHEMYREDWEAWVEQAGASFERQLLPGGHIFAPATQALLVGRIAEILARRAIPAGRAELTEALPCK